MTQLTLTLKLRYFTNVYCFAFFRFFLKFLKKNRRIQSFQVPDSLHVVFLECLQLLLQLQLLLL